MNARSFEAECSADFAADVKARRERIQASDLIDRLREIEKDALELYTLSRQPVLIDFAHDIGGVVDQWADLGERP